MQSFGKFQSRRLAFHGNVQEPLQTLARRFLASPQSLFNLSLFQWRFLGHHYFFLSLLIYVCVCGPFGDAQSVGALQVMNVPRARQVFVSTKVEGSTERDARSNDVDVLTRFVAVQHIAARVRLTETHLTHVIVGNPGPLFGRELVASRKAKRVVPNWLFDLRAQTARSRELGGKLARRATRHVSAHQHSLVFAILALECVGQHATKTRTPADFLHALHASSS